MTECDTCSYWMPRAQEPCGRRLGHPGKHLTAAWVLRNRAKSAKAHAQNREERNAYARSRRDVAIVAERKYREANRELVRKREAAKFANPEIRAARNARRRKREQERYATDLAFKTRKQAAARRRNQNNRAKHLGLPELKYAHDLIEFLIDRDGATCQLCGQRVDPETTERRLRPSVDHIVALTNGGLHVLENLQLAHYHCNSAKGNRW